jgi:hypothetical protein
MIPCGNRGIVHYSFLLHPIACFDSLNRVQVYLNGRVKTRFCLITRLYVLSKKIQYLECILKFDYFTIRSLCCIRLLYQEKPYLTLGILLSPMSYPFCRRYFKVNL